MTRSSAVALNELPVYVTCGVSSVGCYEALPVSIGSTVSVVAVKELPDVATSDELSSGTLIE